MCYICGGCVCFFFQAEDGIRDDLVTGVQTCALPILTILTHESVKLEEDGSVNMKKLNKVAKALNKASKLHKKQSKIKIGRASCRERV